MRCKRRRCREPPVATGALGSRRDRTGDLGEVQAELQADGGSKLGGGEGTHSTARGVVQPGHGSRSRGGEEEGRLRSEGILTGRFFSIGRVVKGGEERHARARARVRAY